jgi:hypothetical protein
MKENDTIKTASSTEASLSLGRSFLLRVLQERKRRLAAISRFRRSVTVGADFINPGGSGGRSPDERKSRSSTDFLRPEDLKPGWVVELAGGRRFVVVLNRGHHELLPCDKDGVAQQSKPIFMFRWGASPAMTRIA